MGKNEVCLDGDSGTLQLVLVYESLYPRLEFPFRVRENQRPPCGRDRFLFVSFAAFWLTFKKFKENSFC